MIKCKYVWIIIKFNIPEGKGSIGFAEETLWARKKQDHHEVFPAPPLSHPISYWEKKIWRHIVSS